MEFKFLQISDLHLDRRTASGALMLPALKRREMLKAHRAVLDRAARLAIQGGAQALVIAGDLFDLESPAADTVSYAMETFKNLDPIPVIIAPGNHDFLGPESPYRPEFLEAWGLGAWPENVFIFGGEDFQSFSPQGLDKVRFTGMGILRNTAVDNRLLGPKLPMEPGCVNVLVLHGSRLGTAPPGKLMTMPFTDEELLGQGFDYAALGHYHSFAAITDRDGVTRAAYSGTTAGLGLDETGSKGGLWVRIETRDEKKSSIELERVDLGAVTILTVDVNVTGCSHGEDLARRMEQSIGETEQPDRTLLALRFNGLYAPGLERDLTPSPLREKFFHVAEIWGQARPGWDLETIAAEPDTTESKFVKLMRDRMESESDPELRAQHLRALYYGLEALRFADVEPRYEDIS